MSRLSAYLTIQAITSLKIKSACIPDMDDNSTKKNQILENISRILNTDKKMFIKILNAKGLIMGLKIKSFFATARDKKYHRTQKPAIIAIKTFFETIMPLLPEILV